MLPLLTSRDSRGFQPQNIHITGRYSQPYFLSSHITRGLYFAQTSTGLITCRHKYRVHQSFSNLD